MLLFYIRHGDPIYDPDSLTPIGHRQAEALAKRLALYGIDRLFSSPSNRARLTAQPTSELTKKPIETLDFCAEHLAWADFAFPDTDGHMEWAFRNTKVLRLFASRAVYDLGRQWYDHPAFEGYTFRQGVERIDRETDAFLASLGYVHDRDQGLYTAVKPTDDRVAVFAHQGFGLAFLSSVLDIPYPRFSVHFDMGHSGMTVIEFKEVDGVVIPRALMVANDSHLYREGLPTYYNQEIRF